MSLHRFTMIGTTLTTCLGACTQPCPVTTQELHSQDLHNTRAFPASLDHSFAAMSSASSNHVTGGGPSVARQCASTCVDIGDAREVGRQHELFPRISVIRYLSAQLLTHHTRSGAAKAASRSARHTFFPEAHSTSSPCQLLSHNFRCAPSTSPLRAHGVAPPHVLQ